MWYARDKYSDNHLQQNFMLENHIGLKKWSQIKAGQTFFFCESLFFGHSTNVKCLEMRIQWV